MTRPDQTRPDHPIVRKQERNSSLELLRIVAMLMIVTYHFSSHGGFNFPTDSITLNRLYFQFTRIFGALGNDIFVMLAGYFLVKSESTKILKLFNLWLRIFFYSVICYCVFVFLGYKIFSPIRLLKSMMPISHRLYWFPTVYLVLYVLHGWLNIFLHRLTHEEYKKFLLTLFILWSVIPALLPSNFEGSHLTQFIFLYSLAGYFRLWEKDFGSRRFILYGIIFIAVNYSTAIIFDIIGLKIKFFAVKAEHFYMMVMPLTICASLCFLLGFRSLKIPHSKVINTIASAAFGVYLIHDNGFVRPFLWREVFRNASFQNSPYLIPYSLAVILIVYISCTILELIRSKIFRTLTRGYLS